MNDFVRINTPRVENILARIKLICVSARSQKVDDAELVDLLRPVQDQLAVIFEKDEGAPVAPSPAPLPEVPHTQRIALFVDALPANQLGSYLTHIANRLCEIGSEKGPEPCQTRGKPS